MGNARWSFPGQGIVVLRREGKPLAQIDCRINNTKRETSMGNGAGEAYKERCSNVDNKICAVPSKTAIVLRFGIAEELPIIALFTLNNWIFMGLDLSE
jgi:hypothetical protein